MCYGRLRQLRRMERLSGHLRKVRYVTDISISRAKKLKPVVGPHELLCLGEACWALKSILHRIREKAHPSLAKRGNPFAFNRARSIRKLVGAQGIGQYF